MRADTKRRLQALEQEQDDTVAEISQLMDELAAEACGGSYTPPAGNQSLESLMDDLRKESHE